MQGCFVVSQQFQHVLLFGLSKHGRHFFSYAWVPQNYTSRAHRAFAAAHERQRHRSERLCGALAPALAMGFPSAVRWP